MRADENASESNGASSDFHPFSLKMITYNKRLSIRKVFETNLLLFVINRGRNCFNLIIETDSMDLEVPKYILTRSYYTKNGKILLIE